MVSERRNELLAELLHRVHFIEKWGRGVRLILSKEPAAEFKEVGNHFIVVFKRKYIEEKARPEKVPEKVPEKITGNQGRILEEVEKNQDVTIKYLSSVVGISERKIRENIRKLKQKGLIKRVGPDRGGYWQIKRKTRSL